jgi:peptidyl-prolyl isomerase E (cyclophilin E)
MATATTTLVQVGNARRVVYVGGLDDGVTEAALHAAFLPFGDIKDVSMPLDNATGRHR